MKKLISLMLIMLVLLPNCGKKEMNLTLPSIFNDDMVLQRNSEVAFWGHGTQGIKVEVKAEWGQKNSTLVNNEGQWKLKLKTPKAGGPYKIDIITDNETISYENVLIGEVWICSGQSNMEMPVKGWPPGDTIRNSEQEIKNADYPQIRLFTVERAVAHKPRFDCNGIWSECSPETVGDFSATAYFFGRRLHKKLDIPIGLIHSSWGGTPAESWTPAEELKTMEDFRPTIEKLKDAKTQLTKLNNWLEDLNQIDMSRIQGEDKWQGLDFNDSQLSKANYDDGNWQIMELPAAWEKTELGQFDGAAWFRKKVDIQAADRDYVLELGPIDDMDVTYFNGKKIGGVEKTGYWQKNRVYEIPKNLVVPGQNTIAVRVIDNQGGGGIYGQSEQMKIYPKNNSEQSISLATKWKYMPVAEYKNGIFYIYGQGKKSYTNRPNPDVTLNAYTATCLYNAMIYPIIPFSIRGAIWYQGESNVGRAAQYKKLFPLMIKAWRKHWDQGDFPFYYVQIAPYNYEEGSKSQRLREAQLKTLSLKNTGMVVTTDISTPKTIHPGNKQDVGARLAKWALAKDYGFSNIVYSGPLYKSMKIEDNKIRIFFNHDNGGLIRYGKELTSFTIADANHEFVPAQASIDGNSVLVWSEKIDKPVAVRFGWSEKPEPNLFNKAGLPASPFRTDNW